MHYFSIHSKALKLTKEKQLIRAKLTAHYLGLHLAGIPLCQSAYDILIEEKAIDTRSIAKYRRKRNNNFQSNFYEKITINAESREVIDSQEVNVNGYKNVDDLIKSGAIKEFQENQIRKELQVFTPRKLRSDIKSSDWKIKDLINLPDEFFDWIESIRLGWQYKKEYEPFNLYKEQAAYLLSLNAKFPVDGTEDEQLSYLEDERQKMLANSLYAVSKYGKIKEDQSDLGVIDINPFEVQAFLLYLLDCNLSCLIGKPRQIGSTTVIALAKIIQTMIRRNYYCKLVANKGDKSEEIFEHKVKFPLDNFPYYIKPTISNNNKLELIFKYKAGKQDGSNSESKFEVCSPAEDVINAGTPASVLLDEVGLNDNIQEIIRNGRPTIFFYNPMTGRLEMRRQVFGWGTADASSPSFELIYKSAKEEWLKKNYRYGLIPIFLNSFAKPGFTMEHYNEEKKFYYNQKKTPGKPDPKIMFHQTYPLVEDDLFLISDDTVVPTMYIKKMQEKIISLDDRSKPVRGYFEPIYNTSIKRDDELVPYRIIGARFCPATQEMIDEDSIFASVYIYKKPDNNWRNRYYQGIDPIFSASGHSKMSAYIWDNLEKLHPAWFSGRTIDYRFCYIQSLLLGLYYSPFNEMRAEGIRQLIEINVGGEYKNMVEDHKYGGTLTYNSMLPEQFQTSTVDIGIRKQGNNTKNIITKLEEMVNNYGDNIMSENFWAQMRTFVKKYNRTGISYEPKDKRIQFDDDIDAAVYAYINGESHKHMKPTNKTVQAEDNSRKRNAMRFQYDNNFNLVLSNQSKRQRAWT